MSPLQALGSTQHLATPDKDATACIELGNCSWKGSAGEKRPASVRLRRLHGRSEGPSARSRRRGGAICSGKLKKYQGNSYLASMAMLGCASEKSMRLLFDAYVEAIDKEANRNKLKSRLAGHDISRAYEEFRKSFSTTRGQVRDSTNR